MHFGHRVRDPDDPLKGKAIAAAVGVALSIASLGLLAWMAMDVDSDGRSSFAEFQSGTSPMRGDSDGDGVADGWELDHGYDPLLAASKPTLSEDPGVPSVPPVEECTIGQVMIGGCTDGDLESDVGSDEDAPPTGGDGAVSTSVLTASTSAVGAVAGRLVFKGVLRS